MINILCLLGLIYLISSLKYVKKDLELLHNQNKYIIKHLSGGIENIPKAYGFLREKQMSLLKALIEFGRFTKEHQIEYWLDYGTLLGAMRHNGFIPWDDDIDVSMTEENLEKLLNLTKNQNYNISLKQNYHPKTALWFFSNKFGTFDIFSHVYISRKEFIKLANYTYLLHKLFFLRNSYIKGKILDRLEAVKQGLPLPISPDEEI